MQINFHDRETRMLATGAAAAVVAGVLMGAAMKPDFGDDRVLGPQFFAADGGVHDASYRPDPGASVYGGRIPDYVIGTDWTRPRQAASATPSPEPREDPVIFTADDEPSPPMTMTYRTWREPPREPSAYPSVTGDLRYPSERYPGEGRADDPRDRYGDPDEPAPN
jgi:hypothetical protein